MNVLPISRVLVSAICGAIFGFGLALSGMLDPVRVRGFLDVAGAWDPRLGFVLGGAVLIATIGVRLSQRLRRPILADSFALPGSRRIDRPLLLGAALFGVGWGMAGFCPGPAIAALSLGLAPVLLFVAAMAAGMIVHDRVIARAASGRPVP